jgi:hypothetical protein
VGFLTWLISIAYKSIFLTGDTGLKRAHVATKVLFATSLLVVYTLSPEKAPSSTTSTANFRATTRWLRVDYCNNHAHRPRGRVLGVLVVPSLLHRPLHYDSTTGPLSSI